MPSEKQPLIIKENALIARLAAWHLKEVQVAITFGHHIYLHQTSKAEFLRNKSWLCHEIAHVQQFEQFGFLSFMCMYLWETLRHGYRQNKWEIEARLKETDISLVEKYAFE